ncbi:MAG: RNA polymerase sigma factor [Asticcacaulis sp.]|uniref:RNA polymerase sigma factor n=1 Tax=Asticcacaulis sp. TaxID=1872648 RepID=UPI0039E56CE4
MDADKRFMTSRVLSSVCHKNSYFGGYRRALRLNLLRRGNLMFDCGKMRVGGLAMVSLTEGDEAVNAAMHTLMARFDSRLRRYLGRALAPADAEDALHDIYVRLARQARLIPPPDFNTTYVFKTADSVLHDLYRRRRSHNYGAHVELPEELAARTPSPFDELRWRRNVDLLKRAIAGLNREERLVLMMHRVEGRKLTEISQKQRIPLRTVQRLLADALAKCRDKLKDSGWFEI